MASDSNIVVYTASDRIQQLNDIDRDVVKLLHSAGLAVKALTGSVSGTQEEPRVTLPSVEEQKDTFMAATSRYFSLLSSLDVRLRRQIYALEEAEILPKEHVRKEIRANLGVPATSGGMSNVPNPQLKQIGGNRGAITGGGLGSLDISWLNSRNDSMEKKMEVELWEEAQKLVEKLEKGTADSNPAAIQEDDRENMQQHSLHETGGDQMEQT